MVAASFGAWLVASTAAADGRIEINQASALAGGVTPGDAPGYPVSLTEPGSYVLTGDLLVGDPAAAGIEIGADHVTLDLGGFAIRCIARGGCAGAGVRPETFFKENSVIRNGSVLGMADGTGLAYAVRTVEGAVEDLFVSGGNRGIEAREGFVFESAAHEVGRVNASFGIRGSLVLRSTVSDSVANAFEGIFTGTGVFAENHASGNVGDGFRGTGVYLSNSVTQGAETPSSDGFQVNDSVVSGNTISEHEGDGVVGRGNLVHANSVRGNSDYGIRCFDDIPTAYHENVLSQNGTNVSSECINLLSNACSGGFCF